MIVRIKAVKNAILINASGSSVLGALIDAKDKIFGQKGRDDFRTVAKAMDVAIDKKRSDHFVTGILLKGGFSVNMSFEGEPEQVTARLRRTSNGDGGWETKEWQGVGEGRKGAILCLMVALNKANEQRPLPALSRLALPYSDADETDAADWLSKHSYELSIEGEGAEEDVEGIEESPKSNQDGLGWHLNGDLPPVGAKVQFCGLDSTLWPEQLRVPCEVEVLAHYTPSNNSRNGTPVAVFAYTVEGGRRVDQASSSCFTPLPE